MIKLTLRLKQNCDDFVLWLNSHGSRNKNGHHFAHVIFNRISCREIAVFWLYKFALRLKENRNHIADDNFQSTILVWVLLYFYLKKSLWDRDESGHHFSDDWVLWVLESFTVPFLPLVIITVSLIGHYSFQPGCHRSHMAVSNTLRPRLNGPLFSSHLFKIPDLSIMNPSEYELPNNLMNIILCPVMLCRRHKICI